MKKFNNKPNECIKFINSDGSKKEYWISRSVGVCGILIAFKKLDEPYLLLSQRGPGTPDFQGYWNLICGYLDFDESGTEAIYREVWEEAGIDLEAIVNDVDNLLIRSIENPYHVDTSPSANKQNISLYYLVGFQAEELPKFSLENMEKDEVSDVRWVPFNEEIFNYNFAFNHKSIVEKVYNDFIKDDPIIKAIHGIVS